MTLPTPERGLVISYSYLWHSERARGLEEGAKDRPCVIILAVEMQAGAHTVTVVPITHAAPANPDFAVEIPVATKRRLGLDEMRSWIVISEGNRFVWPGPDIRPVGSSRFDYGFLPPAIFKQVVERFAAYRATRGQPIVARTV